MVRPWSTVLVPLFGIQLLQVQGLRTGGRQEPTNSSEEIAQLSGGQANSSAKLAAEVQADRPTAEPAAPNQGEQWQWVYFPPQARLGIVTGGTYNLYERGAYGAKNAEILLDYARRKGYALFVDKEITRHSDRRHSWNKIPLMYRLLEQVPMLVWLDPDMMLTRFDRSLHSLIMGSNCKKVMQTRWEKYLTDEVTDTTFLWMSADTHNGGPDQYMVNVAPGLIVLRRSPMAMEFLEKVWHAGDDKNYFLKHRQAANGRTDDWPYEQGAIWEVLASAPEKYMPGLCVPPPGQLQSVTNEMWTKTMLFRNCHDMYERQKAKTATVNLNRLQNVKGLPI